LNGGLWNQQLPGVIWEHEQYSSTLGALNNFTAPFTLFYSIGGTSLAPILLFNDSTSRDRFPFEYLDTEYEEREELEGESTPINIGGPIEFSNPPGIMAGGSGLRLNP